MTGRDGLDDRPLRGATTDAFAVSEAARSSDRAREIVDHLGDGFLSVDADWRITDCNLPAERLLNVDRSDLLGLKLWSVAGFPSDSPFADVGRRVAATRKTQEAELIYRRPGKTRLLTMRAFPLGGGVAAVWRDITNVRAAELKLARSEAQHREVAQGAPTAAWLTRPNGKLEFVNQAMCDALARSARDLMGKGLMEALDPDDRTGFLTARARAWESHSSLQYEARFRRPDGALRILQLYGRPRFDSLGAFRGYVGIAHDVTEVRETEARQRVLINELNHRVKNALATVQSLVRQTLREHRVDREVEAEVSERLIALAAAHDVLTRENWRGAELSDLIKEAIKAHAAGGRISLSGGKVAIAPQTAIALSMALNELLTNAIKHGALSQDDGRVQLSWTRSGGTVELEWRESGGPPVSPPTRTGFGSRLLSQVLAGDLGQPAELDFAPEGLIARIRAPVQLG
jgi:PAS domain S-box-containing protein